MAVQLVRSSWILILLIVWMCVMNKEPEVFSWATERLKLQLLRGWRVSPISSILEKLFEMRAIHRELNTSIPPHSRNGEASHPQNTGEKIKPRKTERICGRWSLCFPISICFPCCFIVPKSSHASHKQKPSCTVVERTDLYLKSWSATLAGWPQASHNPSLTYKMGIPPPTLQCLYIT